MGRERLCLCVRGCVVRIHTSFPCPVQELETAAKNLKVEEENWDVIEAKLEGGGRSAP